MFVSRNSKSSRQTLLVPLIFVEHYRSIAPSTLVSFYAIALGLFGAAELRTFKDVSLPSGPFALKAVNVASLFLILIGESIPKRRLLQKKYSVSGCGHRY